MSGVKSSATYQCFSSRAGADFTAALIVGLLLAAFVCGGLAFIGGAA